MYEIALKGLWRPILHHCPSPSSALLTYGELSRLWSSALISVRRDGAELSYADLCALAASAHERPGSPTGVERGGPTPP